MSFRINEISILIYRIFLVYINYTFCRLLFVYFNNDLLQIDNFLQLTKLLYHGIRFDSLSIVYLNSIFILLSIIPFKINTSKIYQDVLIWIYFIFNGIGMLLNFIDFEYYRFNLNRLMSSFLEAIESEPNKSELILHYIFDYYHILIIYLTFLFVWIFLYKMIKHKDQIYFRNKNYYLSSIFIFLFTAVFCVMGARGGDLKKSTRPITIIDAMDNVNNPQHADIILNTPFTILKTLFKKPFKLINKFNNDEILNELNTIKQYNRVLIDPSPNVIIFILESMGREYWGSMNKERKIKDFKGFTPFLDSLAEHSLVFSNAFATSRKSIHAMPSILAGIPSFEISYTSTPYSKQKIESIVSIANSMDYNTSFFHGASNGSMGFLGFSNTLGFKNYYGRNEFNNDDEYDGYWGIWDEPFLQFTKETLDNKKQPFLATVFTITSHEPYVIPKKYDNRFNQGVIPMHKCVLYTDFSIRKFFDASKNSDWFKNTVFLFTADHSNQSYYPYYQKTINRFANPIMIYIPNSEFKGEINSLASHMDIYPTIVDLIGYKKAFRSWGKSLVTPDNLNSIVVNYLGGGSYFIMNDSLISVHNGEKAIGFYDIQDKNFKNNLIQKRNKKMNDLERKGSMFLQDYFNRIIKGEMNY
ncbi:MAG: sulfatase [Flavobacteriaceae bacterium]|nr:sulfatase [Flavobacteriaceae bacterium]|tara:strand:+ start:8991 stop:10913 length:1923 start_codon:yes stop_codon:yes gene_type:complete